jgi:hypothetical protein
MQPPWQVNDKLNTGSSNTQVHFELHDLLWQTTNYSKALVCWSHDDTKNEGNEIKKAPYDQH